MATEKRINANRENGKKGGPKTPAGRAAVRNNALKHGLSAQHPVIPDIEDQNAFDEFLNQLCRELNPEGIMEHLLVNQIADTYWRRQRIVKMETGLFDVNNSKLKSTIAQKFKDMTVEGTLHLLAEADVQGADMLGRYYRYDARFERSFFKAWKELKSLQSARQKETQTVETETANPLPTEFAKQTQIEPKEPSAEPEIKGENQADHPEIKKHDKKTLR